MAAIEILSILLRPCPAYAAVVPISIQDTSMDDSVEIINILQETEGYDKVQKVKPRSK